MTKEEFLKIQTCVLKVNIDCDGCKKKVKKLLQRIEGAYTVKIDAEHQKVTVSGSVDSATLIKKLARAGKHAELWSQKSNQNQKPQQNSCINDGKNTKPQNQNENLIKGLKTLKNQQSLSAFSSEDDDEDDDYDNDEEDDLSFLREKASQLGLFRQANETNAKKAVASNSHKVGSGGGNSAKKGGGNHGGNYSQNVGLKNATVAEPKNINIAGSKVNSSSQLGGGHGIQNMNVGGAYGNGGNLMSFQAQPNGFQGGGYPSNGFGVGHANPASMMNMQGYQYHPSSMMMNMANRQNLMQDSRYIQPQAQMMYQRSPLVHPYTGYYQYNSYPSYQSESGEHGTRMFSDENTSSCAIM